MPLGPCPECGNYVALSARSCPGCGNRNFTIRTPQFLVTCDSCHGDGKLFDFGVDEFDMEYTRKPSLTVTPCFKCHGKGYVSSFYEVDSRDPEEVEFQFAEAKVASNTDDMIKREAQEDVRLANEKAEAWLRLKLDIWHQKESERAKAHAVSRIKKTLLYAFLSYPVVGFAGCFVRQLNEVHAGNIHNFKSKGFESYSTEAVFVPIVILVVGAIIAFIELHSTKD